MSMPVNSHLELGLCLCFLRTIRSSGWWRGVSMQAAPPEQMELRRSRSRGNGGLGFRALGVDHAPYFGCSFYGGL